MITSLSVYADLPRHHLRSALELITSPPVSSDLEDLTSGDNEWAGADFSGCGDPETFMRFLEANNYCLGYSDSDDGSYDPSRECFNLEVEGAPHNVQGGAGPSRQGKPLHRLTRLPGPIPEPAKQRQPQWGDIA